MQTLFGSYDLSKKKDSLSTIDYMRKRSQLRNVKMTVGRHVTFVTDRQNYFNTKPRLIKISVHNKSISFHISQIKPTPKFFFEILQKEKVDL